MFKKSDEMEMFITNRALKIQMIFFNLALLVWVLYDVFQASKLNLAFLILVIGNILFFATQLIYRKKMVSNNDEK